MTDPIVGAFLYTLLIACVMVVGGIAARPMPKTSFIRALSVPFGLAGAIWVAVAVVVIVVRLIQIGGTF